MKWMILKGERTKYEKAVIPSKSVLEGLETGRVELSRKAIMEFIETGSGSVKSPGTYVSVDAPVLVIESHYQRTRIKG